MIYIIIYIYLCINKYIYMNRVYESLYIYNNNNICNNNKNKKQQQQPDVNHNDKMIIDNNQNASQKKLKIEPNRRILYTRH